MIARKLRAIIREELELALVPLKPKPIKVTVKDRLTDPYVSAMRAAAAKTRQVADQSALAGLEARVAELERQRGVERIDSSIASIPERIKLCVEGGNRDGLSDHEVSQDGDATAEIPVVRGAQFGGCNCCRHREVIADLAHGSPLNDDPTVGGAL